MEGGGDAAAADGGRLAPPAQGRRGEQGLLPAVSPSPSAQSASEVGQAAGGLRPARWTHAPSIRSGCSPGRAPRVLAAVRTALAGECARVSSGPRPPAPPCPATPPPCSPPRAHAPAPLPSLSRQIRGTPARAGVTDVRYFQWACLFTSVMVMKRVLSVALSANLAFRDLSPSLQGVAGNQGVPVSTASSQPAPPLRKRSAAHATPGPISSFPDPCECFPGGRVWGSPCGRGAQSTLNPTRRFFSRTSDLFPRQLRGVSFSFASL